MQYLTLLPSVTKKMYGVLPERAWMPQPLRAGPVPLPLEEIVFWEITRGWLLYIKIPSEVLLLMWLELIGFEEMPTLLSQIPVVLAVIVQCCTEGWVPLQ